MANHPNRGKRGQVSVASSEIPSELALAVINTGEGYKERCALGRANNRAAASRWLAVVNLATLQLHHQFDQTFTAFECLAAALELAEYYRNHTAETDNLRAG